MKNLIEIVTENEAQVVTHGGVFHADDVLATVILAKLFQQHNRNKEPLKVCREFKVSTDLPKDVIVYDIGGGKFDHHQKGGNGARENGVPYSSAGLIWREGGKQLLQEVTDPSWELIGRELVRMQSNPDSDLLWSMLDKDLIAPIDAVDNGVMPSLDYPCQEVTISRVISGFNPTWDSDGSFDEAFMKAVAFMEQVFDNAVATALSKVKANRILDNALFGAKGHVLVLDWYVPWQEALLTSENEAAKDILFVVYPAVRGGYNWQCVPDALGGFGQRKPVPQEWKGAPAEELQKLTGVEGFTFCHPAGFLGACKTQEEAIRVATLAAEA